MTVRVLAPVLALLVAGACSGGTDSASGPTTTVSARLSGTASVRVESSALFLAEGYSCPAMVAVKTGTAVRLKDAGGTLIGTGALGAGTARDVVVEDESENLGTGVTDQALRGARAATGRCVFDFTIDGPIASSDFYTVEVGDRPDVAFRRSELEAKDWRVELNLD